VSDPILAADNVWKRFQSGRLEIDVLRGASIGVNEGESVSIQGESGSGKTTFLNLLAGLDRADSGHVLWRGDPLDKLGETEITRRRGQFIGMVFQSYYLVPEIDALSNALLGARVADRSDTSESDAIEWLRRVGLEGRIHSLPGTFSGGERQRVAIARALIARPRVILADEPTGNLDERTGDAVIELLETLCSETMTSLVLVTHNKDHAKRSDRQLLLHEGRFVS